MKPGRVLIESLIHYTCVTDMFLYSIWKYFLKNNASHLNLLFSYSVSIAFDGCLVAVCRQYDLAMFLS